jgi:hypothetical protein
MNLPGRALITHSIAAFSIALLSAAELPGSGIDYAVLQFPVSIVITPCADLALAEHNH